MKLLSSLALSCSLLASPTLSEGHDELVIADGPWYTATGNLNETAQERLGESYSFKFDTDGTVQQIEFSNNALDLNLVPTSSGCIVLSVDPFRCFPIRPTRGPDGPVLMPSDPWIVEMVPIAPSDGGGSIEFQMNILSIETDSRELESIYEDNMMVNLGN